MNVIIGRDFFSACGELQVGEQGRVLQFVSQFSADPSHPSISLERVNGASDGVWSGRVSQELRAIVYKSGDQWVLLHADHHDDAYDWAERRQIGRHSVTGALQIVDVPEVEAVEAEVRGRETYDVYSRMFGKYDDDLLLSMGLPEAWLPSVRAIEYEKQLWEVCEKLPDDVAERLLDLSTGTIPTPPEPVAPTTPVEKTPGATRRFFVAGDSEELMAALEAPLERWVAFLHPSQKELVDGEYNGPVKVSGSAGTGKTVVALHRARRLAKQGKWVLLATYVTTLKDNLERSVRVLCPKEETRERITVQTIDSVALDIVRSEHSGAHPLNQDKVADRLKDVLLAHTVPFEPDFVVDEWDGVIQAQGIVSWDEYRNARRVGRGTPLSVRDRKSLWTVFEALRMQLRDSNSYSWGDLAMRAAEIVQENPDRAPFDAVVVDELQDLTAPQLRFIRALADRNLEDLMLVGDAGQRIYPGGFSLSRLGIEVRGRSHILRINYRTTEQIREFADRILGSTVDDLDGGEEDRTGTRSLLSGPVPEFIRTDTDGAQHDAISSQCGAWAEGAVEFGEIAVFARTNAMVSRIRAALEDNGLPVADLKDGYDPNVEGVWCGTMHRAKGLEFKAVVVAHASDHVLPYPGAIKRASDAAAREALVENERRLLYVAATRARDELLVTWTGEPSRFLSSLVDDVSEAKEVE